MIPFFRKLRKKMADDNKLMKYMRYAIGEIVLVMVGILLALQVNNWNEERKQSIQVNTALESLMEDLSIQNEIINEQILYEKIKIATVDSIYDLMGLSIDIRKMERFLDSLTARRTFVSVKATFNNLEESGGLLFLKDLKLQNSIVRYYQKLEYTASVVNNNNLFIVDNQYSQYYLENPLHLYLNQNGVVSKSDDLSFEQRYRLQINIIQRKSVSKSNLDLTGVLKDLTQELILQLESALNKQR